MSNFEYNSYNFLDSHHHIIRELIPIYPHEVYQKNGEDFEILHFYYADNCIVSFEVKKESNDSSRESQWSLRITDLDKCRKGMKYGGGNLNNVMSNIQYYIADRDTVLDYDYDVKVAILAKKITPEEEGESLFAFLDDTPEEQWHIFLPGEGLSFQDKIGKSNPKGNSSDSNFFINFDSEQEKDNALCYLESALCMALMYRAPKVREKNPYRRVPAIDFKTGEIINKPGVFLDLSKPEILDELIADIYNLTEEEKSLIERYKNEQVTCHQSLVRLGIKEMHLRVE